MTVTDDVPRSASQQSNSGLTSRRRFLAASGLTAIATAAGPVHAAADEGSAVAPSAGGNSFAVITDVHQSVDIPEYAEQLKHVLGAIEKRDPAFVLNTGDITDLGTDDEFAVYRSSIPASLKDRMRDVPGNHESQWVTDAMETYRRVIGPTHYSFDAAGLHFVALDPFVQHEFDYWHYGDLLDWLERDLQRVPKSRPIVLFQHFPTSPDWLYHTDEDAFLRLIHRFNVRVVFAGHIHKTVVSRFNGVTEVTGKAVKNAPSYFWVERVKDAAGHRLEVAEVTVPTDGEPVAEPLVTIPLDQPSSGGELGPLTVKATASGTTLSISAKHRGQATEVLARLYPQGGKASEWTSLTSGRRSWTGDLDVADLPGGPHRVEVRAVNADGGYFHAFTGFALPTGDAQVAWSDSLSGRVQGGLAAHDGLVVAGTTTGLLKAYRPSDRSGRPAWQTEIGGIYKGLRFTDDGNTVLVPSIDHHLHAVRPTDGKHLWQTDLAAPLSGEVALVSVDDEELACTAAGHDLVLIDLQGEIRWRTDIGGVCAGTVACDGEMIFVGSGDGNAYALDARTGDIIWSVVSHDEDDKHYKNTAYGAWSAHVRLLEDDGVLFTTYNMAYRLDRASGERAWAMATKQGQVEYTPPTVTPSGILIFNGQNGSAHLLDPATGEETWSSEVLRTSFGAAPIPTDDPLVFWIVSHHGSLARIDLADGTITEQLQVSTAFTYSTAVLIQTDSGAQIVAGGQDGVVHGIVGMS